ncbi:hypothetical protein SEA_SPARKLEGODDESS_240 [Streptomyces phage SparkleGoddess]|uniref:Uncharacterized protein n=1 Tax=Streptomyces phage SparkleGoddess TaxID=2283305 RepID=A0A345MED8_9CAUD|nr:hypothetical protein SEA_SPARKLEGODDESS_240 [Streptomyces phage SparkleGoddess]QZE11804.1 hypothetical protein SEA_KARP_238 [Streptomyces phage Karp]
MRNVEVNDLFSPIFWKSVANRQANGERYGQAVFNSAYGLFPNEVGEMVATELDPFYDDSRVKLFLAGLTNRLDKE